MAAPPIMLDATITTASAARPSGSEGCLRRCRAAGGGCDARGAQAATFLETTVITPLFANRPRDQTMTQPFPFPSKEHFCVTLRTAGRRYFAVSAGVSGSSCLSSSSTLACERRSAMSLNWATRDKHRELVAHGLESRGHAHTLLLDLEQVPAELRLERVGDATVGERKGHIGKLFSICGRVMKPRSPPILFSAVTRLPGHSSEVLAICNSIEGRVGLGLGSLHLCLSVASLNRNRMVRR